MSRTGDWMCAACQHQNFKKREACQRCAYPKYGGPDVSTYLYNRTEILAGDCMMGSESRVPPGWKTGDWMCTRYGCGVHNYASRIECFRCKTPRDFGGA
ncbi:Zinc finger family protein, putative isoform 1 [Hibiscus syriacus]|uniref:Zinc finger family protein, putative isoform 1 n=1 Tax=Hibiscus syriacus TaxID=106335 RepID=A0A6A3BB74_HIBSY|nr:Zinc finger family protein, putative isoform 1 [Hibiscus syriacus]